MSQEPCTLFWPRRGFTPTPLRPTFPGEHGKIGHGHHHGGALAVLGHAKPVVNGAIAARGIKPCSGAHVSRRNPGDGFHRFRRIHRLADEVGPAGKLLRLATLGHIGLGFQPFRDNDMGEGVDHGHIGAGPQGQMKIRHTCGERTMSMRRGSSTISLAPSRRRFFMREAKTGWASVGLAPITSITSHSSTDLKSWVPADVPKVLLPGHSPWANGKRGRRYPHCCCGKRCAPFSAPRTLLHWCSVTR